MSLKFLIPALLLGLPISSVMADCPDYDWDQDFSAFPESWEIAPGAKANDPDFLAAYNKVDWSKMPNVAIKKWVDGSPDASGYSGNDPDCWWTFGGCVKPKASNVNPDIYECSIPHSYGLTFDDGPNCTNANFYKYFQEQNQEASLFYVGSNVMDWPREAKAGLASGHHIALHTWSHPPMTSLSNQQAFAELYFNIKIVKDVIGVTPRYWRPPYGDIDDRIRFIATQLDLTAILWNKNTDDWGLSDGLTNAQVDNNFQKILDDNKNGKFNSIGALVLQHEINDLTMNKAIEWYPKIKAEFDQVLPITACSNITRPYAEDVPASSNTASATKTQTTAGATKTPSINDDNKGQLIVDAANGATGISARSTATVIFSIAIAYLFFK